MADSVYSRTNPFPAKLVENTLLSGKTSAKEARKIAFDLSGSGLEYRVGQSLGVCPTNSSEDVAAILKAGGYTGEESVTLPKAEVAVSLRQALTEELYLASPTRKAIEALAQAATDPAERSQLESLLLPEEAENLKTFLAERFFVDLLEEFPSAKLLPEVLVELMRRLQPRLYSIASSPKKAANRVELAVDIVRYTTNGRARNGVCSSFMADRIGIGGTAKVFVGESPFGLTDDDAAPIIMVGPGVGIAPFRAFLQERTARGASGDNWLFFGDQHRESDFLFEAEFSDYLASGLLTRLDLAWSRDQDYKIYVQDLMRQNSAQLYDWIINRGACFYVCGDAKRMAKDVETALVDILKNGGAFTDDASVTAYLAEMKQSRRYMRDVY